jgi:hypothetical protein
LAAPAHQRLPTRRSLHALACSDVDALDQLCRDDVFAVGAGIAALVAAFGLTWKGIGEFFGRAAAAGEAQLWDAELDWAIARRFTMLTNLPNRKELEKVDALKKDQPMTEHMRRHQRWKAKWPEITPSETTTKP